MKTLLTLTALAVALSIPSFSFAGERVNTFGVELPAEKEATNYKLKTNNLYQNTEEEYNALGVQFPLEKTNIDNTKTFYNNVDSEDSIVIFGVKVPVNAG